MVFTASEVLGSAKIEGNSLYAEVKAVQAMADSLTGYLASDTFPFCYICLLLYR